MSVPFTNYYCISSTFSGTALSVCRRKNERMKAAMALPRRIRSGLRGTHVEGRALALEGRRLDSRKRDGGLQRSPGVRVGQAGQNEDSDCSRWEATAVSGKGTTCRCGRSWGSEGLEGGVSKAKKSLLTNPPEGHRAGDKLKGLSRGQATEGDLEGATWRVWGHYCSEIPVGRTSRA